MQEEKNLVFGKDLLDERKDKSDQKRTFSCKTCVIHLPIRQKTTAEVAKHEFNLR